jgi:nucleoside-diphosphate-sugar epimerase
LYVSLRFLEEDSMRVAITGANGRIGTFLADHWRDRHEVLRIGEESDLRAGGDWENLVGEVETVVHLAAVLEEGDQFSSLQDNVDMVLNVVRAAHNVRRIIYASSMWAIHDLTSLGSRGDYYSASKRAGEAIVRGWSDVHRRPAVSLRIGKFGPEHLRVPIEHEMLRVDAATLRWWFDKAMAYDEPTHSAWLAVGRSDHL